MSTYVENSRTASRERDRARLEKMVIAVLTTTSFNKPSCELIERAKQIIEEIDNEFRRETDVDEQIL